MTSLEKHTHTHTRAKKKQRKQAKSNKRNDKLLDSAKKRRDTNVLVTG
jgi:hypothetical protein